MTEEKNLSRNILMHHHNVYGKTGGREVRIHERTTFLARKRVVVHSIQRTQKRLLRFLPLKDTKASEYLQIPDNITTEDQLWDYVVRKKPFWVERHIRMPQKHR